MMHPYKVFLFFLFATATKFSPAILSSRTSVLAFEHNCKE